MNILSIDWDYFYPDGNPYDMGHSEHHSPTLANFLWTTRTGTVNLITKEPLLETYIPTIPDKFWGIISNKPTILVAESHFRIWNTLQNNFSSHVTSLDAHHDCGYQVLKDMVDCSNWAAWGMKLQYISDFQLHYPQWRKTAPEGRRQVKPSRVIYGDLPEAARYDRVFICRSGAWTTPWHDDRFLKFLKDSECKIKYLDDMSPRMSMKEALASRDEWNKNIQPLMDNIRKQNLTSLAKH